jgi:hypothetical protein
LAYVGVESRNEKRALKPLVDVNTEQRYMRYYIKVTTEIR